MSFRYISRKNLLTTRLHKQIHAYNAAKKSVQDVQIIVIGAGLAGLSAARHLIENGFTRTIVLEATERFGGRIRSKQFGDVYCELGAKWIHMNDSKNSMYELLQQTSGVPKQIQQRNELHYIDTCGERANQKLTQTIDMLFRKLILGIELNEKCQSGDVHELNNVHTYLRSETHRMARTAFQGKDQLLAIEVFDSLIKEFGSLLGDCLEYVNIEHLTKLKYQQQTPIYIPTGLDCALKEILSNVDPSVMKIGKPVGEIKWGHQKSSKKSVSCLDGTIFPADHIICTLPLGVLKEFSKFMFKPMLPKEKQNAIKNLGFGSPVKIYFEYKENVKPWLRTNIRPLWKNQTSHKQNIDLKWTKQVVEISKLQSSNRVLDILIGGQYYNKIERLPDTEILEEITKLLRTCLRNPAIPYPNSILRSNWSSSACYLGGRPYFSTESCIRDVNSLAAPLGDVPNLLFAGDATIINGFGTIDGARMSGIREAERIIKYYNPAST